MDTICIGWTTVESEEQAQVLAQDLVESGLAACVQIDGAVISHYRWEGQLETSTEYRLAVKFTSSKAAQIQKFLDKNHPYATPQWLAVSAQHVHPDYAQWVLNS